jgi:hypothetical protein
MKSILTQQFSASNASKDFLDCDVTDFRECVFAEAFLLPQNQVAATVTKYLRIRDDGSPKSRALRDIVIVGHSPEVDLKILQRPGVDVYEVAPVLAVVDTFRMTPLLLWPTSASVLS